MLWCAVCCSFRLCAALLHQINKYELEFHCSRLVNACAAGQEGRKEERKNTYHTIHWRHVSGLKGPALLSVPSIFMSRIKSYSSCYSLRLFPFQFHIATIYCVLEQMFSVKVFSFFSPEFGFSFRPITIAAFHFRCINIFVIFCPVKFATKTIIMRWSWYHRIFFKYEFTTEWRGLRDRGKKYEKKVKLKRKVWFWWAVWRRLVFSPSSGICFGIFFSRLFNKNCFGNNALTQHLFFNSFVFSIFYCINFDCIENFWPLNRCEQTKI